MVKRLKKADRLYDVWEHGDGGYRGPVSIAVIVDRYRLRPSQVGKIERELAEPKRRVGPRQTVEFKITNANFAGSLVVERSLYERKLR